MRLEIKAAAIALSFLSSLAAYPVFAQETIPFLGEVDADNINIRSDATVSSEIICQVNRGDHLEAVRESYGWYKVRLPKSASSFVKKKFAVLIADTPQIKNAKISAERVNIRLRPTESSPILGKLNLNEVVNIIGEDDDWYRIEPVNNSFGWINKKFLVKATGEAKPTPVTPPESLNLPEKDTPQVISAATDIALEGIIKPYGMVFKRAATHKLVTTENKIFLLTGNKKSLDTLNHHRVKVTGKLLDLPKQKYPVIEIETLEALD